MSSSVPVAGSHNRLINHLPRKDRNDLLSHCKIVPLVPGSILGEADHVIQSVYFPLSGLISLMEPMRGHKAMEMGLIGNEGMLGATMVLGIKRAPMHSVAEGAGTALRMTSEDFLEALDRSPTLKQTLNRYLYVTLLQASRTTACTHFHNIETRLARRLLMTHDRVGADELHLTHKFLAQMLGVRRSGITVATRDLQGRHLIQHTRGRISILDRPGLENACCTCYDAMTRNYSNWLT